MIVERNCWRLKEMVECRRVEGKDWILIKIWHVRIFILALIRKGGGAGEDLGDYKIKCFVSKSFKDKDI